MDQKLKNFDRNIEQMMNENAVTPPFGMWNRIAGELEADEVPDAASVNSPIPQRTIFGFIAGAALIGASLITAYVVDNSSKSEVVNNATITAPAVVTPASVTTVMLETPTAEAIVEVKPVARRSAKPQSIAKVAEEKTMPAMVSANAPVVLQKSEVMIPNQEIAENSMTSEPYYFPAIDMGSRESKPAEKAETFVVKAKPVVKADENERETVSDNDRVKKFRPKKHKTFSYGRIIRRK